MDIKLSQDFFLSDAHAFCLFKLNNQAMADIHGHEFDELVIVCGGCGFHVVNDQVELIHQGDFFYVSANDVHYYNQTSQLSLINILIHKQRTFYFIYHIDDLLASVKKYTSPSTHYYPSLDENELNQVIADAAAVSERRDDCYDRAYFAHTESRLLSIFTTLYQSVEHAAHRTTHGGNGVLYLLNYIRQNYSQSINWQNLCEIAGLSPRTMYRAFNDLTGSTPQKFQQIYRLLKAQEKLRTTDLPVKTIAAHCGFSHAPHLTEMYKKQFSRTPTQERQLSRSVSVL
ncbi:AraC family transcriptional regulator [Chimaeribacter californicus]|uniref:AraC family transcriptional regulator n=1 Tax=Chimaeribacter californicus TaxID=2060067 RepID=A0A2N5E8A1_9GAMM|nr:helix-turn-helix domain-containing protein [Chimaeribacter californicus]PLR37876.1 AraC family transcriptional regulator [Chimaeribacter californicus]